MPIWGVPRRLWYSCTSCGFATNKWDYLSYSDTGTQSSCRLCWLWNEIGNYAVTVITICAQDSMVNLNLDHMPGIPAELPWIREWLLKIWQKTSILPRQSPWQIGLANNRCWICHEATQNVCPWFSCAPKLQSYGSEMCGFDGNLRAGVAYSNTAIQYRPDFVCCQLGLPNLQWAIYLNETQNRWPELSVVPESGWIDLCSLFWLRNVYMATGFQFTSKSLRRNDSNPFAASFSKFYSGLLSWHRPAREIVI